MKHAYQDPHGVWHTIDSAPLLDSAEGISLRTEPDAGLALQAVPPARRRLRWSWKRGART